LTTKDDPSSDFYEPWKIALAAQAVQLAAMAKQIAELRDQVQTFRTPTVNAEVQTDFITAPTHLAIPSSLHDERVEDTVSTCSTVEDCIETRVSIVEGEIASIRGDTFRIREHLKADFTESIRVAVDNLIERLDHRLANHFESINALNDEVDDLRAEVSHNMHEMLEDLTSGVKLELQEFIDDEMLTVERTITDKIKGAFARAVLTVDLDDLDDHAND
jgi:hypothetical protein